MCEGPYGGVSGPKGPEPALSQIGSLHGDAGSNPRGNGSESSLSRLAWNAPKMWGSCALESEEYRPREWCLRGIWKTKLEG